MKKVCFLFTAALIVSLAACDAFFSTSWGIPRVYDASKIKVSVDNLDQLKSQAVGNPGFARAAGKATAAKIRESGISDADKAQLMGAAVEFAWIGSELGSLVLDQAGNILGNDDNNPEDIANKFVDSLGPLIGSKGFNETLDNLIVSADVNIVPGNIPAFIEDYKPDASEVDKAVLLLLAGLVGEMVDDEGDIDWDTALENTLDLGTNPLTGKIVIPNTNPDPDPAAVALAAYLNLVADDADKYKDSLLAYSIHKMLTS